jgi:phosphoribosylanthranilate isomerase
MDWNWSEAQQLRSHQPVLLAGGLTPDNVKKAIAAGSPAAVDVSSGVEIHPGCKDIDKVAAFCQAVATCGKTSRKRIFK